MESSSLKSGKAPSKLGKYNLLRTLGVGAYSKVKLGVNTETGERVAIKIHKRDSKFTEEERKVVINEVKTIMKFKNDHLISIKEFHEEGEIVKDSKKNVPVECVVVQELAEGGELFYYVLNSGAFSTKMAVYFFKQMMEGIHAMHQAGYAHRDLKPDNILLSDNFQIKIADFGFAGALSGRTGDGMMRTILGTKPYMAPELNEKKRYKGTETDVFALGVILFIIVAGTPPFNEAKKDEFYYKFLFYRKYDLFWKYHCKGKPSGDSYFSPQFKDLI